MQELIDRATATALMRSATVRFESDGWAATRARSLRDDGRGVVRAGGAQISDRILKSCRTVASARLSDLLARVGRAARGGGTTVRGCSGRG